MALIWAEDYPAAMRARAELARATGRAFWKVGVMLLPTAEPAARLEPVHPSLTFTRPSWTAPFSLTGNPALSICSGFDAAGLPFSLQIAGRLFERLPCCAQAMRMNVQRRGGNGDQHLNRRRRMRLRRRARSARACRPDPPRRGAVACPAPILDNRNRVGRLWAS
jgi:Asp-tRNA(Asn)/Glu-tRNA(Gln) amidotransferase A subunit family amidase